MPKKKGQKKNIPKDFTLNDCANAPKPVGRVKKSTVIENIAVADIPWDQVPDDEFENFDIVEEINADGTKNFIYKDKKSGSDIVEEVNTDGTKTFICNNKKNGSKSESNDIENRPGNVYPEVVWYQISKYIKPEDIGYFAGINKSTYAITGQKSFWRAIYKRYCENNPKLPNRLKIENSYRNYGLRQRVIRALYHTYDVFIQQVFLQSFHDCKPHELVRRRCVNVWFCKGISHWSIYFKFKKLQPISNSEDFDIIEELGRIDANPEENSQVLEVICQNFNSIPPLMGMTLSSVSMLLSQGFRHHRMHLGFNTGHYAVSKNILPECTVVLDTVKNIMVFDWWHPRYPHFENRLPWNMGDEEALPVLKKDFFSTPAGVF